MGDAARPTPERSREAYDTAFRLWMNLHLRAVENPALPTSYLSVHDVCHPHPYFPPSLRLKVTQPAGNAGPGRLYATGYSTWGSPPCHDGVYFSSFRQGLEIEMAASCPTTLFVATPSAQGDFSNPPWFTRPDTNYVPVLMLAWAYILSARWTALLAQGCSMTYTDSKAAHQDGLPLQSMNGAISSVDIGPASPEETRWWAAVLAPGQGWQSTMAGGQQTSPWSIILQGQLFSLRVTSMSYSPSLHTSAASFSAAVQFLDRFCRRHDIMDQSHAALAAVLLLPCFGRTRVLRLSHPKFDNCTQPSDAAIYQKEHPTEHRLRHDWVFEEHHIDRLLALSCNIRGIRPLLLSVFYEPWVDCNLVSSWLQGTVTAIDSISNGEPHVLGRMLMERDPSVAFLWAGATILQLQRTLLDDVRRGQIPVDLHSAAWSGTIQSFLQQPVSSPLVVEGCISRADECRLLFLSQSGQHARVPICQWQPFGVTAVEDTDLEVRIHDKCENHWLQYQGFTWDCTLDELHAQSSKPATWCRPDIDRSHANHISGGREVFVPHHGFDRKNEVISENATRSIFSWLRYDGWAQHEKVLRAHEWFDVLESDDDDEVSHETESASTDDEDLTAVEVWLSDLVDHSSIADEEQ